MAKMTKVERKAQAAEARVARIKDKQKESVARATRTALTMGGALAMAYYSGRNPDRSEILGVDASLVIGGGLTIAALMGWAGKQDTAVEALGNGALATYAAKKGLELGTEAAQKA